MLVNSIHLRNFDKTLVQFLSCFYRKIYCKYIRNTLVHQSIHDPKYLSYVRLPIPASCVIGKETERNVFKIVDALDNWGRQLGCVAIGLCTTMCEQDNYHDLYIFHKQMLKLPQAALMGLFLV